MQSTFTLKYSVFLSLDIGAKWEHPRTPRVSTASQKEPVTSPMVGTAAKIRTKAGIAVVPALVVTTLHGITIVPALAVTYQPPHAEGRWYAKTVVKLNRVSPVAQGPTPALPRSGDSGQPSCPLKGPTYRDSGLHPSTTDPPIHMTQTEIQPPVFSEPVVRHADVSPAVGHTMLIPGTICGKDTLMVVDTAAQRAMISQPFFDSLKAKIY